MSSPPNTGARGTRRRADAPLVADASRFAVVDVETTGLDPATTRVLECAIVELAADGHLLGEWTSLVSVPGEGELGASWLHGITRSMLVAAPPFRELAGELAAHLAGHVVVGHVLDFDLAYLAAEYAEVRARAAAPSSRRHLHHDLARANLPPGPRSLVACCRALGVRCPAAHTALGDARAAAAIFQAFLRLGVVPDLTGASARAAALTWPAFASPSNCSSRAVPRPARHGG